MRRACLFFLICALGCRTSTSQRRASGETSTFARPTSSSRSIAATSKEDGLPSTIRTATWEARESPQPPNLADGPIRLTLQEAIRTALASNPELVALQQDELVSAAALDVARTYPYNPQASVDVRPFTREANGNNAATLVATTVQQEIELAHQGRYREQAGAAELDRTRWNLLKAEVATTAAAEQRFFAALYQRQRRDLAESQAKLNQELLELLERRQEANLASATDVSLARIQAGTSRQQAELARVNYEAALVELRSTLGLPASATIELIGDLERWKWLPLGGDETKSAHLQAAKDSLRESLDSDVAAKWLSNRPDIRAAEAEVEAARARLRLACASRVPNIKAGPIYEHDEAGTQFFGLEASIALPVLNTGGPLARQRHAELHQRLVALEQLQLKAKLEIQAALSRYDRARQTTEQYSADFSDKMAEEVRLIEDQFKAGQTDLLRVYSARTSMIQSRQTYLDSLQELTRAAAAITAATGLGPEAFALVPQEGQP